MFTETAIRLGAAALVLQLAGAAPSSPAATEAGPNDLRRVVATVNGQPIRARQLDATVEADRRRRQLGTDLSPAEWRFLKRRALERLIGRELLFQAAKRKRMKVSRRVLNEQLAAARPGFASDEIYRIYLEKAGLTEEELIRRLEYRLLSEAYAKEVTDRVDVDDSDARKVHEEDRARFASEEEVRCAHIVLLVDSTAPADERETARARLEQIRQMALDGERFEVLARENSDSPFAERGGDLGFLPRGRMRPEFDAVVFDTPVGGITPVFETAYGFNLVQVLERKESSTPTYDEVKASLLMHLTRQRKRDALQGHIDDLWKRAKVVILDSDLEIAPTGGSG